jgi:hypothetical protein
MFHAGSKPGSIRTMNRAEFCRNPTPPRIFSPEACPFLQRVIEKLREIDGKARPRRRDRSETNCLYENYPAFLRFAVERRCAVEMRRSTALPTPVTFAQQFGLPPRGMAMRIRSCLPGGHAGRIAHPFRSFETGETP